MKRIVLFLMLFCVGCANIHRSKIASTLYRSDCKYFYISDNKNRKVFSIGFCSENRYISCHTEYLIDYYSKDILRRDYRDSGLYQIDSNRVILRSYEFLKDTIVGIIVNNCVSYLSSFTPRFSDTLIISSESLWLRGEFCLKPISYDSLNTLLSNIKQYASYGTIEPKPWWFD